MAKTYYGYFLDDNNFAAIKLNPPYSRSIVGTYAFEGELLSNWSAIECLEVDDNDEGTRKLPRGDFPCLDSYSVFPVMSERAWEALSPTISKYCEALPLIHPSGEAYFLVHIKNATDALDRTKSKYSAASDGRISNVYEYSFNDKLLEGLPIFRLPFMNGSATIVTDEFRKIVESNSLKGFYFQPLKMAV